MAASTGNMVQSASGKLYDANSPQGIMIRSKGGTRAVKEDSGEKGIFGRILESLQTHTSLLFQIDDNTESDETAAEKRKRRIKEEDTDEKKPGIFSKIGSGLKATGGALQKMNPFSEGIGTKTGILLLAGLLFAISRFGDKLVKPLASVLEMIDKEGGFLDKFKDTDFFKNTVATFESIKVRAKELQTDVAEFLESVSDVSGLIASTVDSVKAFIGKFDTQGSGPRNEYGDGKLDAVERQVMFDTIKQDIIDAIVSFTTEVVKGIKGLFLTVGLVGATLALIKKNAAMATIFGAPGPLAHKGIGVGGYLAIAGLLIYGITTTWTNFTDSMKKSLEANNDEFIASDFFGRFFGGKDEGGWMNALGKAFDIGATGALAGMSIGALIGLAGGPIGVLAGGFIGLGIGAVIGGITGWLGKNKMEDFFKKVGTAITETVDIVVGFFTDVVAGVESALAGDGFTEGYNKSQGANYERNKILQARAIKNLADAKEKHRLYGGNEKQIARYQEQVEKYTQLVEDSPQQKFNNLQADINTELEEIKAYEAEIKSGNMYRGIDPFTVAGHTFQPSDVTFQSLIEKKLQKIQTLRAEQDAHRIKYNLTGLEPTRVDLAATEKKLAQQAAQKELLQGYAAMSRQYTYPQPTVVPIVNADSHDTTLSTFVGSSLDPENKSTSARLLSSGGYATLGNLNFLNK